MARASAHPARDLHGYDLEEEVGRTSRQSFRFDAAITGRFELEAEQTREGLGTLVVLPR